MSPLTMPLTLAPSVDPQPIAHALRARDRLEVFGIVSLWIGGLVLLPWAPALIASVIWMFASRDGSLAAWLPYFWGSCVVTLPIGFALAIRGASAAMEEAAEDMEDVDIFGQRYNTWRVILLILCVMGPGCIVRATRMFQALYAFRHVSRPRAADTLARLLSRDASADIFSLLRPGEPLEQILPVLEYLNQYDWIGASRSGDRIWASTEGRKKLEG